MSAQTTETTPSWDQLLGDIETMAKSQPAATAEGAEGEAEETEEEEGEGEPEGQAPMAKSFEVTLADGSKVTAVDGSEVLAQLGARIDVRDGQIAKALGGLTALVKSQGDLIAKLSAAPRAPRRSVLTVNGKEPATIAKSETPAGISGAEFMVKGWAACQAGKISARELNIAEQYVNAGQSPPAETVQKVLGS